MAALATAFACVWIALVFYVGWLARNQSRLAARLHELEAHGPQVSDRESSTARAA
jgi:CcmD family protein